MENKQKCTSCGHSELKWDINIGRKKEGDKILLFHGHAVAFEDVARMCIFFMNNEDILYPPDKGYKGAKLFQQYIVDVLKTRQVPKDEKYRIRKNHGITKAPD